MLNIKNVMIKCIIIFSIEQIKNDMDAFQLNIFYKLGMLKFYLIFAHLYELFVHM